LRCARVRVHVQKQKGPLREPGLSAQRASNSGGLWGPAT